MKLKQSFLWNFVKLTKPFRNLRIVHFWVLLCHFPPLTSWPDHEGIHRSFYVISITHVWFFIWQLYIANYDWLIVFWVIFYKLNADYQLSVLIIQINYLIWKKCSNFWKKKLFIKIVTWNKFKKMFLQNL